MGITTILNPAPYQPLTDDLLDLTDWLIPNEIEFAELDKSHREPNSDEVIASLRSKGRTIVTLGSEGAALVTKDGQVTRFDAMKVSAIDTTGAGDAYIGGFLVSYLANMTLQQSMKFATIVASENLKCQGARDCLPNIEKLESL